MIQSRSIAFGNTTRTGILLILALIEDSYPKQMAEVLETPASNIFKALDSLEREGLVVTRLVGRTRQITLNPRYFARDELRAYLDKLALSDAALIEAVTEIRKRPRRTGKTL